MTVLSIFISIVEKCNVLVKTLNTFVNHKLKNHMMKKKTIFFVIKLTIGWCSVTENCVHLVSDDCMLA